MRRLVRIILRASAAVALMGVCTLAQAHSTDDEAAASPWGPADEIGALNLMTEASRFSALSRVSSGKVYDLAVDLFVGMPTCCSEAFGDPGYQSWMTNAPARGDAAGLVSHSGDAVSMSTHTGTHIDTLSHFRLHGRIWNRVTADDALGARGWSKSGADKYPPIVARGVLIDVARSMGVAHLPSSYSITVEDLHDALRGQGTAISRGDVVLVRTGLMSLWPDDSGFQLFDQAGLSLEAAEWLVGEQGAMFLGADNLGLESFPSKSPENFAPVHSHLLAGHGVSFMELLWLEELSKDQVYEFLFVASPLKMRGATGSPVRPIAIPMGRSE